MLNFSDRRLGIMSRFGVHKIVNQAFMGAIGGLLFAIFTILFKRRQAVKNGLFLPYDALQHNPYLLETLKRAVKLYKVNATTVNDDFRKIVQSFDMVISNMIELQKGNVIETAIVETKLKDLDKLIGLQSKVPENNELRKIIRDLFEYVSTWA